MVSLAGDRTGMVEKMLENVGKCEENVRKMRENVGTYGRLPGNLTQLWKMDHV